MEEVLLLAHSLIGSPESRNSRWTDPRSEKGISLAGLSVSEYLRSNKTLKQRN